jgi:hypothetical protein
VERSEGVWTVDDDASLSIEDARSLLSRVIPAVCAGDPAASAYFTEDVRGDGPHLHVRSRTELEDQLTDHSGVLSNVKFTMDGAEEIAGGVIAIWRLSGYHTGSALMEEDELVEPSGRRIDVSAMTLVQFRGAQLCSFQTLYDSAPLFEQIRWA